jgi:hypothetical protein
LRVHRTFRGVEKLRIEENKEIGIADLVKMLFDMMEWAVFIIIRIKEV